jgi:hypothetical protein
MYDVRPIGALPDPFSLADAVDAGLTRRVVERLVRNGEIIRVRRGIFRQVRVLDPEEPLWQQTGDDHLTRARVALLAHPQHAISHQTGAVARGWPVQLHPTMPVHMTAVQVQPRSRRVADRVLPTATPSSTTSRSSMGCRR